VSLLSLLSLLSFLPMLLLLLLLLLLLSLLFSYFVAFVVVVVVVVVVVDVVVGVVVVVVVFVAVLNLWLNVFVKIIKTTKPKTYEEGNSGCCTVQTVVRETSVERCISYKFFVHCLMWYLILLFIFVFLLNIFCITGTKNVPATLLRHSSPRRYDYSYRLGTFVRDIVV
jgi:hypothetical protein